MTSVFPKDFFWGGATSASQIEGGYNEGGKGLSIYDVRTSGSKDRPRYYTYCDKEGKNNKYPEFLGSLPEGAVYNVQTDYYYPSHRAIDFYHNYKSDISMFAEMGFKMFRMSIDWSRIYPKGIEKEPNLEGIAFYRSIFQELKKHHIEPLITLWHGETPLYIENHLDGWNNRMTIEYFLRYAKTVLTEFKDDVHYWLTFNEINNMIMFLNIMPEEVAQAQAERTFRIVHHRLLASARVVQLAHEINPCNKVGCMICYDESYPYTCDPKDILATIQYMQKTMYYCADVQVRGQYPPFSQRVWNAYSVKLDISEEDREILRQGKVDFFSLSYYCSSITTTHDIKDAQQAKGNFVASIKNPYLQYSKWGWSIDADGLRSALNQIYDRYQIPIIVVENGLGAQDILEENHQIHDLYRIDYLRAHIQALKETILDGVDVFGYTSWGCIDEISMVSGEMDKRYGFIYVDLDNEGNGTRKRYKKDSFAWYQKVIASNGERLE